MTIWTSLLESGVTLLLITFALTIAFAVVYVKLRGAR